MAAALPERVGRIAAAVAEALVPPTEAFPHSPADVGFVERLASFLAALPWPEAFGVRLYYRAINLLPLLVGPRRSFLLALSLEDRAAFFARIGDSRLAVLRNLAKVALLLTTPAFYADQGLREALGDRTHLRVAKTSTTFPVEVGGELEEREIEVDVVVVGSGAGGAPVARELAERGRSVVVLEEGPYRPTSSFPALAFESLVELYRDAGITMTLGSPPVAVPMGRLVGGTTVINSGTCFRIPGFVHEKWAEQYGMPDSLGEAALAPLFERVEEMIGVQPVTQEILGGNNDIARRGSEALGWSGGYLPRNYRGCVGSNRCAFGCPTEAKQAMHLTYLPAAVEAGARVISGAHVDRVTFRGGRATGVVATTRSEDGARRTLRVRARAVVVSAGTFHTPLLLRASGIRHRNLGKRLTLHPGIKISGLFPGANFYDGPGVPQSYYVDEFHGRGIMMEGAHVPPDMLGIALPGKGKAHKELMERSRELATYGFLLSDQPSGAVHRGLGGRPFVRYDIGDEDLEAILFGLKKLARLFVAAGATRLFMPSWKLPVLEADDDLEARIDEAGIRAADLEVAAFHPLGTCGLGPDPATFPLDTDLRVRGREGLYVADGSVMPSSLAVNPQLSIMALATRCAFHLDEAVLGEAAG